MKLSDNEIKQRYFYDPETGYINSLRKNKLGSKDKDGYLIISSRSTGLIKAHRLAWFLYYGEWPIDDIDHRDRNKSNNKINNLRIANDLKNSLNKDIKSTNKSGYKGVCYCKQHTNKKWKAQLTIGKLRILNKCFINKQDAIDAYEEASKKYHGEFAGPLTK